VPYSVDESQVVSVRPPLQPIEIELVAGLAGVGPGPRQVWPGQPGRRSPWVPCTSGCCLKHGPRRGADPVVWLRFLLRELLAPAAREPLERIRTLGLPGDHRVEGRVLLDGAQHPRLLVAIGRRVRVVELDQDLFPVEPVRRRERGEVVPMDDSRAQRTER